MRPAIRASTRCCVTLGIHRRQVLGSYFDSMGMDGITSQYPSCCCTESKKYARLPAASACHPRGGDATRRGSGTAAPAHSSSYSRGTIAIRRDIEAMAPLRLRDASHFATTSARTRLVLWLSKPLVLLWNDPLSGIRFALAVRKTRVTRTAFADLGWQPC